MIALLAAALMPLTNVNAIVASEREFSKQFDIIGFKKSFLKFFADDGISFTPDPGLAKPRLQKQPDDPKDPDPIQMSWEPVDAMCSSSGDIGYSTGPLSMKERASGTIKGHGHYFSIWKKQKDGDWKVVLDVGIGHGDPGTLTNRFINMPTPSTTPPKLSKDIKSKADLVPFEALDDHSRIHFPGSLPFIGPASIRALPDKLAGEFLSAKIEGGSSSSAGDMVFDYGTITLKERPIYFTRLWRWNGTKWILGVQVIFPGPLNKPA